MIAFTMSFALFLSAFTALLRETLARDMTSSMSLSSTPSASTSPSSSSSSAMAAGPVVPEARCPCPQLLRHQHHHRPHPPQQWQQVQLFQRLDVLVLNSFGINITIVLILLSNGSRSSCSRGSHLSWLRNLSSLELLSGLHLSLLSEILNLGLSKDDIGIRGWILVDIWLVDNKEDIFRLSDCDTRYSSNLLQTKL